MALLTTAFSGALVLLLPLFPPMYPSETAAPACEASLKMQREGAYVEFVGHFRSEGCPASELEYGMEIVKEGTSGTSNTKQGGAFKVRPDETMTLSTVRLGVQTGDRLVGLLTVSDGTGVIAGDSVRIVIGGQP